MESYKVDNIPCHADKLLFAQDLVSYMMKNVFYIPYETKVAEPYREFIYNAFNDTVREAVYRLYTEVEHWIRYIIDDIHTWDDITFAAVAERIYEFRFEEGFEAKYFLWFCVEVTILAKEFRNKGLLHAPDMAANLIFHSLEIYDMFLGGWDTLNRAASRYVSLYNECDDLLTPETTSSEESESEIEFNSDKREDSDEDAHNCFSEEISDSFEMDTEDIEDSFFDDEMSIEDASSNGQGHRDIIEMSDNVSNVTVETVRCSGSNKKYETKSPMVSLKDTLSDNKATKDENFTKTCKSRQNTPLKIPSERQKVIKDDRSTLTNEVKDGIQNPRFNHGGSCSNAEKFIFEDRERESALEGKHHADCCEKN